ncbi:hypothetical protein [Streptomyces mirabilis]|uniref:hypothetical protein n=1 Tax=Streptomyces mirabilis TaxID=68239 RepID=UPI0036B6127D
MQKTRSAGVKSVASGVMRGFSIVTDAAQGRFALSAQDVVSKMRVRAGRPSLSTHGYLWSTGT